MPGEQQRGVYHDTVQNIALVGRFFTNPDNAS